MNYWMIHSLLQRSITSRVFSLWSHYNVVHLNSRTIVTLTLTPPLAYARHNLPGMKNKMTNVTSAKLSSSFSTANSAHSSTTNGTTKTSNLERRKEMDERSRSHARQIFNKAVASVLPHEMIKHHLHFESNILTIGQDSYPLNGNVYVVGFGKAVLGMVREVDDVLGHHIVQGVVSIPVGAESALRESGKLDMIPRSNCKVKVIQGAAHNLPDENAFRAASEIRDIAESVKDGDLLLVLISGGGSALLPFPHPPMSLDDLMQISKEMSKAGASIKQLNYMRKQLEVLKGGGLARLASPAKIVALILSDVIGDPLDFIASGPTVPDDTSAEGCLSLFSQLGIQEQVPESVSAFLKGKGTTSTSNGQFIDSPVKWENVKNVIIGSNSEACESAFEMSMTLGYKSYILSTELDGEARDVGSAFAVLALFISSLMKPSFYKTDLTSLRLKLIDVFHFKPKQLDDIVNLVNSIDHQKGEKKKIAIIAGGETTVTVKGTGKGGRNQEMALSAALKLKEIFSENVDKSASTSGVGMESNNTDEQRVSVTFLSGGTDGQDGPTPAAGGVVSLDFIDKSLAGGFDADSYLDANDSYTLLKCVNDGCYLLECGLTGTNVMDINLLLVEEI